MLSDEAIKADVFAMLDERKAKVDWLVETVRGTLHIQHHDVRTMAFYTDVLVVIDYEKNQVPDVALPDLVRIAFKAIVGVLNVTTVCVGFRAKTYYVRLHHSMWEVDIGYQAEWHWSTECRGNPVYNFKFK
jgi:hypothetical protein